jgi:hypothetical protein
MRTNQQQGESKMNKARLVSETGKKISINLCNCDLQIAVENGLQAGKEKYKVRSSRPMKKTDCICDLCGRGLYDLATN